MRKRTSHPEITQEVANTAREYQGYLNITREALLILQNAQDNTNNTA